MVDIRAATQTAVLLAFGLQHKTMHIMCEELDGMPEAQVVPLPSPSIALHRPFLHETLQVLALYKKTMRKLSVHLDEVCKDAVRERIGNEMEERGHKKMDQVTHMKALSKSLAVS